MNNIMNPHNRIHYLYILIHLFLFLFIFIYYNLSAISPWKESIPREWAIRKCWRVTLQHLRMVIDFFQGDIAERLARIRNAIQLIMTSQVFGIGENFVQSRHGSWKDLRNWNFFVKSFILSLISSLALYKSLKSLQVFKISFLFLFFLLSFRHSKSTANILNSPIDEGEESCCFEE